MLKSMLIALMALLALPGVGMAQPAAVTFDPVFTCPQVTLSNGNLTVAETGGTANYFAPLNSAINSGSKVYFEVAMGPGYSDGGGNGIGIGVFNQSLAWACGNLTYPGIDSFGVGYFAPNPVFAGGAQTNTWVSYSANGSVVSFAIDTVNNKLWARVNGGNWNNDVLANQNPATNTGGQSIPTGSRLTPVVDFRNGGGGSITGKFASTSWSFSAPAGFTQLTALPPLPSSSAISGTSISGLSGTAATGINCRAGSVCGGGIVLNLVTDLGATCNGVGDDGPSLRNAGVEFRSFQATNPGSTATLIIPPGSNCQLKTCPNPPDGSSLIWGGISNTTIIATGASITATNNGNCQVYTASLGTSAQAFQPNNIGDTCVTMTTPGTETQYPVGSWAILAGQGMQVNSFPPNYANWEYAQVASNTGGKVCFTAPIKNFYPNDARAGIDLTFANSCAGAYCGGPGKLVGMAPVWGSYFHIIGGTWDFSFSNGGSVTWPMRTVIFDNVTWNNNQNHNAPNPCWYPSFVGTVTYNNSNFQFCLVEIDKEIDQIIANNSFIRNMGFQSQSVNTITLNSGSTVQLGGAPLHVVCNNSTIPDLRMGTTFGTSPQSFAGTNCSFPNFVDHNAFNGFDLSAWTYLGSGNFALPHTDYFGGLDQWLNTGGRMRMQITSISDAANYFTVTGSSVDDPTSTNSTVRVTTTLPNVTLPAPGTGLNWASDQVRDVSCSGCTGSGVANDLNFPAAQHKPLNTYMNRTYTCVNNIPNVAGSYDINTDDTNFALQGSFVSLIVNVIRADTNPTDTGPFLVTGPANMFNPVTGTTAFSFVIGNVNLKIAGARTILSTSITGAQSGDLSASPSFGVNTWMGGNPGIVSNNGTLITNGPAAQCPVVNVIWQTTR